MHFPVLQSAQFKRVNYFSTAITQRSDKSYSLKWVFHCNFHFEFWCTLYLQVSPVDMYYCTQHQMHCLQNNEQQQQQHQQHKNDFITTTLTLFTKCLIQTTSTFTLTLHTPISFIRKTINNRYFVFVFVLIAIARTKYKKKKQKIQIVNMRQCGRTSECSNFICKLFILYLVRLKFVN